MQTQKPYGVRNDINYIYEPATVTKPVNLVTDSLAESVEFYKVSDVTDLELQKRLMSGEIVMLISRHDTPDSMYMIVLTTKLTGRIPSLTLPTDAEATRIVNKHDDLINQAFTQIGLTDRKSYAHMTIGTPNPPEGF